MSRDYAFRGRSKLGGAKWPWAVSITAIRPNEVRPGTLQTPYIFNLHRGRSLPRIYTLPAREKPCPSSTSGDEASGDRGKAGDSSISKDAA